VLQHQTDQRFRITPKIRILSDGFTDQDHISHISRPFLRKITRKLSWPVALATISGVDLIVRENTDKFSPLAIENFSSGFRMPILHTASGVCILAYMSSARQKVILDTLAEMDQKEEFVARQRDTLDRKFREIRRRGYAIHHRHRKYSDLTAIAVPILLVNKEVRGAVTIRYARTAMQLETAVETFMPVLTEAADGIAKRLDLHFARHLNRPK
jgi:IclR family mhp operon transcriptional activator